MKINARQARFYLDAKAWQFERAVVTFGLRHGLLTGGDKIITSPMHTTDEQKKVDKSGPKPQ